MEDEPTPPPIRPKKDLVDASEDAIAEHQKAGDWDTDTVKQVRTAIRLFDYLLLTELPPPPLYVGNCVVSEARPSSL